MSKDSAYDPYVAGLERGHSSPRAAFTLPDANCVARGDDYVDLAQRCFAAGGLSDRVILDRFLDRLGLEWAPVTSDDPDTAAWALARHGACAGEPEHQLVAWLCWLAAEVPGSPDDPDEIAFIARAAIAECSA